MRWTLPCETLAGNKPVGLSQFVLLVLCCFLFGKLRRSEAISVALCIVGDTFSGPDHASHVAQKHVLDSSVCEHGWQ